MNLKRFFTLFFLITNIVWALEIGPTMFEQRIDGAGGYREFVVSNSTNTTLRYKLTIYPGSNKERDMSKWTEVSPKILTIKPGKTGTLKIFTQAPNNIPEGEYNYILSLKTMDLPKLPGETNEVASAAKLNFDFRLGFTGYAGDLKPNIELVNPIVSTNKDGQTTLTGTIVNKTSKRGIYCAITVMSGEQSLINSEIRVPVNEKKEFTLPLKSGVKKSDVTGVIIRNLEDDKELLKKPL